MTIDKPIGVLVNSILELNETSLEKFRSDRKITLKSQRESYLTNMNEEIQEFIDAKDEYETIDALCDMMVFTLNVINKNVRLDVRDMFKYIDKTFRLEDNNGTTLGKAAVLSTSRNNLDKVIHNDPDLIDLAAMANILLYSIMLMDMNCNPVKALDETIKEISSRQQDPEQAKIWDTLEGVKWLKDKNQDPSTLYKADYEECEILF